MPKNKGGWQEIDEEKQSECMNLIKCLKHLENVHDASVFLNILTEMFHSFNE